MFAQRNLRQLLKPLSAVIDLERKVFSGDVFIRYVHNLIMEDDFAKTTDKNRQKPTKASFIKAPKTPGFFSKDKRNK